MRLVQKVKYKYTNNNDSRYTYNRISDGMGGKLELEGEVMVCREFCSICCAIQPCCHTVCG